MSEYDRELPHRNAWPAYACFAFVALAIILEFIGGRGGPQISAHKSSNVWPSTWPDAARVIWWLAVATAAGAYKAFAYWVDRKPIRHWVVLLTAMPFLFWTIGIASGATWASFR